jgi:NAD(P)-dependent dehydrogenase (short-subunit alcohol dehydrogenase family)
LSQGLFPLLSRSKFGSVINIGSIYGSLGPDWNLYEGLSMSNPAAYSTSKAGVIHLTKWLSSTMAPKVRVNTISPGGIFRAQDKQFVDKYVAKTPLNRMATEEDIVGALIYFASDMSLYTTGQNLIIDGGLSIL